MTTSTLDYPLGRPIVPATTLRRTRPLAAGMTPTVAVGEPVRPDQPIAQGPSSSGSPASLLAGLGGVVSEIVPGQSITVEGPAMVLQGVIGVGGPVAGPLVLLPRGESFAVVPIPLGAIILCPQQLPLTLLQRAVAGGAAGIIAPSASARELEAIARVELSALLDGLIPSVAGMPFTVFLSEGLGAQPMRSIIYQLLSQHVNEMVLLSGTTDPRQSVRPEAVFSLPARSATQPAPLASDLIAGAHVAVMAGARRGAVGEIVHLVSRQQIVASGLQGWCASVRFDDGGTDVLALHLLERIG